jgi:glycosyltransferase involved in cell wall biosynthesis
MNVVVISPFPRGGVAARGGVEGHVVRLVRGLEERGIRSTVIAPGPAPGTEHMASVRIIRLRCDQRLALPLRLRTWRAAVGRALRSLKPDIVHGHGLLTPGVAASDWPCGPSVVTAHGNIARDALALYDGVSGCLRARLASSLARQAANRAQAVVGVSADWRVNVPTMPARYVHIPPIVDPRFEQAAWDPVPGRVLFCGGSHPIKGWPMLAAAWPAVTAALPGARLEVLAWEGAPAVHDPTGTVRFRPHVNSSELCRAMAQASAVVVPSSFEVTPTVLAEAWAIGVPVIATSVGGIPAMAKGAAVLVAPEDAEGLAYALAEILCSPRREYVAEGRRRVRAHSATRVASGHLALYEDLLVSWPA